MGSNRIDLDAPILPGIGAAGILLGGNIADVIGRFPEVFKPDQNGHIHWNDRAEIHSDRKGILMGVWSQDVEYGRDMIRRGFTIGADLSELLIRHPDIVLESRPRIVAYESKNVVVSEDEGFIYKILVRCEYRGKFDDKLGVGTKVSDLSKLGMEWYEDEWDDLRIRGTEDIGFEVRCKEGEIEKSKIDSIYVQTDIPENNS